MSSFISVQVGPDKWESFKVPPEVATYIKQLEMAILTRSFEGIERLYPRRFSRVPQSAEGTGREPV